MKVGDELVDNLKEDKSMDFHFVSENDANDGIKDGKYYMVVTIPENFSKNASTLISDNPKSNYRLSNYRRKKLYRSKNV